MGSFVSDHKRKLIEIILKNRTRYISVVMENIYQSQNASAVLRSADCFGIQDVHIIENDNLYDINPDVALGSNKWISIRRYNQYEHNTAVCIEGLKLNNYKVLATSPRGNISIDNLKLNQKTAMIFGNELHGLSEVALSMADDTVYLPMYGFTESFNISVSAAIIMSRLRAKMELMGINFGLDVVEKDELRLEWYRAIVRNSDKIEARFLEEHLK